MIATRKIGIRSALGMGHFRDRKRVDILEWSGTHLNTISTVRGAMGTLSRQDMR